MFNAQEHFWMRESFDFQSGTFHAIVSWGDRTISLLLSQQQWPRMFRRVRNWGKENNPIVMRTIDHKVRPILRFCSILKLVSGTYARFYYTHMSAPRYTTKYHLKPAHGGLADPVPRGTSRLGGWKGGDCQQLPDFSCLPQTANSTPYF